MNIIREFVPTADERDAFDDTAEGMPVEALSPDMAPLEVDAADWMESVDVIDHGGDDERPHRDDEQ